MTARTDYLHPLLFALLAAATSGCAAAGTLPAAGDRRDGQVAACVASLARDVGKPLSAAPDFASLHEATAWVARQLTPDLRARLTRAGAAVAAASSPGAARDAFADKAVLSAALLGNTLDQLQAVPGCTLDEPDSAVPREALLDQFNIGLALEKKTVIARLHELGVDDAHYAKQVVFYGVVLDLGGIAWTDAQLAAQVKHLAGG